MFTLGIMYELGIGVDVDEVKAFNYYESSALGGDLEGMFRMGTIYMTPLLNVKKNMEKAIEYFEMAADQDHLDALYNLGYIYENGIDVEIDERAAIYYYETAADLGDSSSIQALIRIYSEGKIVERDDLMAQRWRRKLKFG